MQVRPVKGFPPTVQRAIHYTGPKCSLAEMHVARGTDTPTHSHPHATIVYMLSGACDFRLDGQLVPLKAGESLFVEGGLPHGFARNDEDLVFLEFFVPGREDFAPQD